jgi:hypothetical protein
MDACEALDSSDGSNSGSGRFSRDELCIVLVYAATIGLLLLGPLHILGGHFERRGKQPPFFLERTSYAPLLGLVLLAVIPTSRASGFRGIVTASLLGDVIVQQFPVVVSEKRSGERAIIDARCKEGVVMHAGSMIEGALRC